MNFYFNEKGMDQQHGLCAADQYCLLEVEALYFLKSRCNFFWEFEANDDMSEIRKTCFLMMGQHNERASEPELKSHGFNPIGSCNDFRIYSILFHVFCKSIRT